MLVFCHSEFHIDSFSCSQSEVGDGTFVFKASDAGEISQVIDWRIKNAFQSTGSPFEGGANNSPPPPQVPGVCCVVAFTCIGSSFSAPSMLYGIEATSKWLITVVTL